jgi:hypothetical protein
MAEAVAVHPTTEVLLAEYQVAMDLYKHYIEMTLKFNVFYYAVTGAVLSFYFSNAANVGVPRYGLLVFPVIMSLGFGGFFLWAAGLVKYTRMHIMVIVSRLGFNTIPEMHVLTVLLRLSGTLFIAVALGLLILICHAIRA